MDRNSPVTEAVLEALSQLLADDRAKEFDTWQEARKHLADRIEFLSEDVAPYSKHEEATSERGEILNRLEAIEKELVAISLQLEGQSPDQSTEGGGADSRAE